MYYFMKIKKALEKYPKQINTFSPRGNFTLSPPFTYYCAVICGVGTIIINWGRKYSEENRAHNDATVQELTTSSLSNNSNNEVTFK